MTWRIEHGDCREVMAAMEPESVQCCVTSPPYWGLRDYGVAGQLGLEPTPEAYVAALVEVFREVRRVLRKDGTLWLNLGDSYTGSGKGGNPEAGKQATNKGSQTIGTLYGKTGETAREAAATNVSRRLCAEHGMKPKDLVGIPWRVAFALQADGWWLRSDTIWAKPNPMPESVRDRPTRSHEYLFLLTKAARYYYDAESIAEPGTSLTTKMPDGWDTGPGAHGSFHRNGREKGAPTPADKQRGHGRRHAGFNDRWDAMEKNEQCSLMRNARSVWTIATHPYPEAHFATFPPEIPRRCILAGSRVGDTVLDPFAGAGTTLLVADRLQRDGIGIELNADYCALARARIAADAPLLNAEQP